MPITLNGTSGVTTPGMTLGSSVVEAPSGSAPSYTCRAWVTFNGTGTVAIQASGNVSSITDNGTGDYTMNMTTAMSDIYYATFAFCKEDVTNTSAGNVVAKGYRSAPTTTATRIQTIASSTSVTMFDCVYVYMAVFR